MCAAYTFVNRNATDLNPISIQITKRFLSTFDTERCFKFLHKIQFVENNLLKPATSSNKSERSHGRAQLTNQQREHLPLTNVAIAC